MDSERGSGEPQPDSYAVGWDGSIRRVGDASAPADEADLEALDFFHLLRSRDSSGTA